ncbi:RidA family protein [Thalassotalea sp. PS06]|nr:RidA family protein [Thalassotalea sp. PS06]
MADSNGAKVEHINRDNSLNLPFSEAVRVDNILFLSGQIGNIPRQMKVVEGGISAETRQTMTNIKNLMASQNLTMNDLVKCTVMLADIKEWPAFNEVYREFFTPPYPARSAFAASGLALNARVEVECIAAIK